MSYDLYFKSDSAKLNEDQLASYFCARPHYIVKDSQAFYKNDDTGVYFSFDFGEEDEDEYPIAFELNYFRPHFFGLEAVGEVASFVEAFHLSVDDPQTDGMGEGAFSIEGFLRVWNAGNRFGYSLLSQRKSLTPQVYPSADLERVWLWNLNRSTLQHKAGDSLFVPKFMFIKGLTQARAAVVWPNACPIYMPKTDIVFIVRDALTRAPNSNDSNEVIIAEWADIEPIVSRYSYDDAYGYFRLDYESVPDALSQFIRSLPMVPYEPEMGVANDCVLNAELVTEIMSTD